MKRTLVLYAIAALTAGTTLLQAQPKPKSQKEVTVLQKMFSATDPDARIAAAEELITNFADSDFKPFALLLETQAYESKGSYEKTIVAGERTLEADPKQFEAMLILALQYIGHVRDNDLDREEKLSKGEKYAKDALAIIPTAQKMNPAIPDDQWATAKKESSAEGHQALGMAAMARKKYPDAVAEFKQAVDLSGGTNSVYRVRLASALNKDAKYDEALAELDKVKADTKALPAVQQFASSERAKAMQGKSGGAPKP